MSMLDQATARAIACKLTECHGKPRLVMDAAYIGEPPIYVVVCANDKPHPKYGPDPYGPIVHETYVREATLAKARERCAMFERYGACRIARLVFEDEKGQPL